MLEDYERQFLDTIESVLGHAPDEIIADGRIHRFSTNGKRGDQSGWYIYHSDGIAAGAFGCWRTGIKETWHADIGRELTPEEEKAHRAKLAAIRKAREAEELRGHREAATKAERQWAEANPEAGDHPYINRKGIGPHGTRVAADGRLLIPMRDTDGVLWNLERISEDGADKKGLYRGKRTGCYFSIGTTKESPVLCICEGYATGASIHEATGFPVVVAFNAGDLLPVSKAIRKKYPDLRIVICADDDYLTKIGGKLVNPGLTQANEAANAVGAAVAAPVFGENRGEKNTDFNDMHQAHGLDFVRECIEKAAQEANPVDGIFPPPDSEMPCYRVLDKPRKVGNRQYNPGVYQFGIKWKGEGEEPERTQTLICSPLHIDAITRNERQEEYGRLLRFINTDGQWKTWAMSMNLLKGSGEDLRGGLLSMGVEIIHSQRARLLDYLQSQKPSRKMLCASQTGWYRGSFILPDTVIDPDAQDVVFQSENRHETEYATAGTLKGWKDSIAAWAMGNALFVLDLFPLMTL